MENRKILQTKWWSNNFECVGECVHEYFSFENEIFNEINNYHPLSQCRQRWCNEQRLRFCQPLVTCWSRTNSSVEWPHSRPSRCVWSRSRTSRRSPSPWRWCQPLNTLVLNVTWNKLVHMDSAALSSTKRLKLFHQRRNQRNFTSPSLPTEVKSQISYNSTLADAFESISGLCGAVHTGVARQIRFDLADDPSIKVICVGDKSRAILQRLYSQHIINVANDVNFINFNFRSSSFN